MYKSIFIDLDDTLWNFKANANDTFQEMYDKYGFERYFDSFDHFYELYQKGTVNSGLSMVMVK